MHCQLSFIYKIKQTLLVPYGINNYAAVKSCDSSDLMKQRDVFWICNIQSAYDKHRRETQLNERQRGTGRRVNVDKQEANQHYSSARKCPGQQPAGVGGGSVTLSKGCQSQFTPSLPGTEV